MTGQADSYDVLIVGAGPSGSQVAHRLATNGYNICVLERKKTLDSPVCCTGLVSSECVEEYSIPEEVICCWANGANIFSPSGKSIIIHRDKPQVAVLNRTAFNQTWAERAQKAGAEYLFGSDVKGIEHKNNKIKVEVSSRGELLTLQGKAIVLASGFGTKILDGLGLGGASDFVMGAQTEVSVADVREVEIYFGSKIAPGFFAWLVPTLPGKALVGLLARQEAPLYLRKFLASLVAKDKIVSGNFRMTYGGVPLKPLPHTHDDNLLVIGTAAGQVKPITGGGIYFGLMCADIAANTLHHALEAGNLSSNSLSGYERAWRRKLTRELRTGYWARKAYEMLSDRQVSRVFELLESTGLIKELEQADEFSFDWHGDVIARVMGQQLFARAIDGIKRPFYRKKNPTTLKRNSDYYLLKGV